MKNKRFPLGNTPSNKEFNSNVEEVDSDGFKSHGTLPYYAVVTPLRKAAWYEPRIAILGIWGDTWLTRGKYGIYVAVCGNYGIYVTPSDT